MLLGYQLIGRRYEHRFDVILRQMRCSAFFVTIEFMIGGYLVLKYIREYGNPFVKIALRCPAVNMAEVLTKSIMKNDELDLIRRGKNVQVGFDRKIEVNNQFLIDLEEGDIRKSDYIDFAEDILILHGTKDEVVPFDAGKQFADDNLIEFIPVENADHRFQNPACMEIATKAVLEFFGF